MPVPTYFFVVKCLQVLINLLKVFQTKHLFSKNYWFCETYVSHYIPFAAFCLKSLPNDKNIKWSKLKKVADDKKDANEMMESACGSRKNIVGKGENAGYNCKENIVEKGEIAHFEQFHLFPPCFTSMC